MAFHSTPPATPQTTGPDTFGDGELTSWYLAYTRPGHERLAQQHLGYQGFLSYLPLYKRLKNTASGAETVFEPMFPRYVFFRPPHAGQSIAPVNSTRGISHIIRFGGVAATIPQETLGIIQLLEQERNAADPAALHALQPGQKVRFAYTAFSGLEGLVKSASSRRVAVLLEIMGRQQVVHADHHWLQKI